MVGRRDRVAVNESCDTNHLYDNRLTADKINLYDHKLRSQIVHFIAMPFDIRLSFLFLSFFLTQMGHSNQLHREKKKFVNQHEHLVKRIHIWDLCRNKHFIWKMSFILAKYRQVLPEHGKICSSSAYKCLFFSPNTCI